MSRFECRTTCKIKGEHVSCVARWITGSKREMLEVGHTGDIGDCHIVERMPAHVRNWSHQVMELNYSRLGVGKLPRWHGNIFVSFWFSSQCMSAAQNRWPYCEEETGT